MLFTFFQAFRSQVRWKGRNQSVSMNVRRSGTPERAWDRRSR